MNYSSSNIYINIILFVLGLYILVKGSDWFVDGAAFIARKYHVSELVIGLTLVSIGTSLPELATNICAAYKGAGDIAVGTVVGSNIANIAFVLAAGMLLVRSFPVTKVAITRDGAFLLFTYLLFLIFVFFNFNGASEYVFDRWEGGVFLLIFSYYMYILMKNRKSLEEPQEHHDISIGKALFFLLAGLMGVFLGAKMMVDNIIWCAKFLSIPKGIIAGTIVAFGTSVPELAVTIAGMKKKEYELALGNIVGSCILNLLLVLGATALIAPLPITPQMLNMLPFMMISGGLLVLFMIQKRELSRAKAVVLLIVYSLFILMSIESL